MIEYDFQSFKDFFSFKLRESTLKGEVGQGLTLQELSQKLGYNSASSLSMIASGQRLPSAQLLDALLDFWNLKPQEKESIRIKVEIERRLKKGKDILVYLNRLKKIQTSSSFEPIKLDDFRLVRDWQVLVIRELVGAPGFREDPQWISQKLKSKVSLKEVRESLRLLEELKMIKRDLESGSLVTTQADVGTESEVYSEAIQEHHKSMMERAKEALKEEDLDRRFFNSLVLKVDSKKIAEVKQRIEKFVKELNEISNDTHTDEIFQLNVQFFPHTKKSDQETKK